MRFRAGLTAVMLTVAGCALPSLSPSTDTVPIVAQGTAILSLQLGWGRGLQAIASDVDHLKIVITPQSGSPIEREFDRSQVAAVNGSTVTLDIANLPGGPARVHLEAYGQGNKLGSGDAVVGLLVGRRTAAHITIQLTGEGNSDIGPLLPMGELPNEAGVSSPMPSNSPSPIPTESPTTAPRESPSASTPYDPVQYFFPRSATARWTYRYLYHVIYNNPNNPPIRDRMGIMAVSVVYLSDTEARLREDWIDNDPAQTYLANSSNTRTITLLDNHSLKYHDTDIITPQVFTRSGDYVTGSGPTGKLEQLISTESMHVNDQMIPTVYLRASDGSDETVEEWRCPEVGLVRSLWQKMNEDLVVYFDVTLINYTP